MIKAITHQNGPLISYKHGLLHKDDITKQKCHVVCVGYVRQHLNKFNHSCTHPDAIASIIVPMAYEYYIDLHFTNIDDWKLHYLQPAEIQHTYWHGSHDNDKTMVLFIPQINQYISNNRQSRNPTKNGTICHLNIEMIENNCLNGIYSKNGYYLQCGIIGIAKSSLKLEKQITISFKPQKPKPRVDASMLPTIVNDDWGDPDPNTKLSQSNKTTTNIDFVTIIKRLVFQSNKTPISLDWLEKVFHYDACPTTFTFDTYYLSMTCTKMNIWNNQENKENENISGEGSNCYHYITQIEGETMEDDDIVTLYDKHVSRQNAYIRNKDFSLKVNESIDICIETIKKNEYRLCFYKDRNMNKRLASSEDFILNLNEYKYYFAMDSLSCACPKSNGFQFRVTFDFAQ